MNKEELKEFLPHREPMFLLDEANLLDDGSGTGRFTIKGDEWFLQGHFPNRPIVPGVIQCEIMAQACSILLKDRIKGNLALFTGINNVKFKNLVVPGDTIEIRCKLVKDRHPFYFTSAECYVGEKLCSSGDLSFIITKGD